MIYEYSGASLTSTKQFVWADGYRREARNSGGSITAQYFLRREAIAGNIYFLTSDHLGSVREMTDSSGNIKAQYSYDLFGRVSQTQGSASSDFQFASYYEHGPSGLNLTRTRAYNGSLGRFINRDPNAESAGSNLFDYTLNNPISFIDPSGLQQSGVGTNGGGTTGGTPGVGASPGGGSADPGTRLIPGGTSVDVYIPGVNIPGIGDVKYNFNPNNNPDVAPDQIDPNQGKYVAESCPAKKKDPPKEEHAHENWDPHFGPARPPKGFAGHAM
jgi:RHS repeat-associated protein